MELLGKIFQLILFAIVTILFVPMFLVVHFFSARYEKWFEKIMEL